jgi:hypothetical protein
MGLAGAAKNSRAAAGGVVKDQNPSQVTSYFN